MEFKFALNKILGSDITRIDHNIVPHVTSPVTLREYKAQLCTVIDKMGEASGKAQGLSHPITSASRLSLSKHIIYIMKDAAANNGHGAVVGFLKVGHKRLFVYDRKQEQHEIEPLCALDFYVHESRQRTGCGRRLFDFMLKAEGAQPHMIAIDRPSHKFLSFLAKHYNLRDNVPQVNKFVVFDNYFRNRPVKPGRHSVNKHQAENQHQRRGASPWSVYGGVSSDSRSILSSASSRRTPTTGINRQKEEFRDLVITPTTPPISHSEQTSLVKAGYSRHMTPVEVQPAPSTNERVPSPPSINRDGPSQDYLQMNGLHSAPLGRRHVTPTNPTAQRITESNSQRFSTAGARQPPVKLAPLPPTPVYTNKTRQVNTGWNVLGVPTTNIPSATDIYKRYRLYKQW